MAPVAAAKFAKIARNIGVELQGERRHFAGQSESDHQHRAPTDHMSEGQGAAEQVGLFGVWEGVEAEICILNSLIMIELRKTPNEDFNVYSIPRVIPKKCSSYLF